MKRRAAPAESNPLTKALPALSVMLGKLPALREFITATSYDDGSPRQPGYFTFRNRTTTFEVTAYDVDAGLRLACRGEKIDDAFALLEQLLGVEDAPWEVDNYLMEQAKRRAKKKWK